MEKFIRDFEDDNIPSGPLLNLEDETPKSNYNRFDHLNDLKIEQTNSENEDNTIEGMNEGQKKFMNKFNKLINNLRLIRKVLVYFLYLCVIRIPLTSRHIMLNI